MNDTLKLLFEQDREEHASPMVAGSSEYDRLRLRDSKRRRIVKVEHAEGRLVEPEDFYRAAWILNHGDNAAEAELAYQLARQSMDAGYGPAKWLFAAAYDRWCMYSGMPQKFGTQIVPDGRRYRLWDVDPETSDDERKQYDVPSLQEMRERAARESAELAQPPMDKAPAWLLAAVKRWEKAEGPHQ